MRKVREVLRLKWGQGLSHRAVARSCGLSKSAISEYVRRAEAAGLRWPLPADLEDAQLEQRLFPPVSTPTTERRQEPDWVWVHQELRRPNVTLFLLWQEYKAAHPQGYHYSWFCARYQAWARRRDVVMRQHHRAGEKLFVDYAGQTVAVVDRLTGLVRPAQVFVAVLGASNYTYAEATWSQGLADWLGAHVRALAFLGGVPEVVVPDNLKSAVRRAHRYEPDLNPSYQDWAHHYGVAVVPARVAKPRDKAKVEVGLQVVQRWILARLRHRSFFSLAEVNEALAEALQELNRRPFRKLPGSRQSLFETLERPLLRPLPAQPYQYAEWKTVRVNIDYHVEVDGHYYSVPYTLVKQPLEARLSATTVELFQRGQRVASHQRSPHQGRHTTVVEHMPRPHQHYAEWTPERLVRWAATTGPATARLVEMILASRPHPQQGFRPCLGLMRLGKRYGQARLEAACQRAVAIGAASYKSVQSILQHGLDRQPLPAETPAETPVSEHPNLRGATYYH